RGLIALAARAAMVAAIVAAVVRVRRSGRWQTAEGMRASQITPATLHAAPARPDFVLAEPGQAEPQPLASASRDDSADARVFREAATAVAEHLHRGEPDAAERPVADLPGLSSGVIAQLQPQDPIHD